MELKVAIAGLGAIGKVVAARILKGISGLTVTAIATRREDSALAFLKEHCSERDVRILPLKDLPAVADVIVECLPSSAFDELAEPSLRRGRSLVVVRVDALIARPHLFELAKTHGGRIIVPTGALIGLDAVQAAALGKIYSVRMITRKPPSGLVGAPYLLEHNIDLEGLAEPLKVYEGPARHAVMGFPANVNVVGVLSLGGIGPDRTTIEICAIPGAERNQHIITAESDSASFSMEMKNISSENPRTGKITALSRTGRSAQAQRRDLDRNVKYLHARLVSFRALRHHAGLYRRAPGRLHTFEYVGHRR